MSEGNAMVPAMNWASAAKEFGAAQEQALIKQVFACLDCVLHDENAEPPKVVLFYNGSTRCVYHARWHAGDAAV